MLFFVGLGLQLLGLTFVGLCLFAGITKGDYGYTELIEFVGGGLTFYLGAFLSKRG